MGLRGILVAVSLVFATMVFMLVAAPVIAPLYDMFSGGAVASQGYSGQLALVRDAVLIYVPTMLVIGIILYAYAATQKNESFFGGGLGRGGGPR